MRRITSKHQPPDTRLSWRDPNMPVIRDYKMGNGERKTVIDADYEHRYREMLIATAPQNQFPTFRNDPTYNLKRKRK